MAKARALAKRRKSIRNIRKITRTMELIANARFKKAMDRASAATAYTRRITQLVADLSRSGLQVSHPLLQQRETVSRAVLLVLTAACWCSRRSGRIQSPGNSTVSETRQQPTV
jgi:F-type H+-transporting ATPase subunit gamma